MSARARKTYLPICVFLALATLTAYWSVKNNDFIMYDDGVYIYENPHVYSGLSRENIVWALTAVHAGNWHPLTWMSHMLDCDVFGLNPAGHHLVNLALHIANTILLLTILLKMTGEVRPSALTSLLFALHPIHVESVAWAAERKDVLSTLFWMLTILNYHRYVLKPCTTRYLLVMLTFALGLTAKPMLVTLPCVLLLLDYWPLRRFGRHQFTKQHGPALGKNTPPATTLRRLITEKIPMFVLVTMSCVITFSAQRSQGAVIELERISVFCRLGNVILSYCRYLLKTLWPSDLAVLYPLNLNEITSISVTLGLGLITAVSIVALTLARRHPYLIIGWLWYLGTLVPVAGFVHVGAQGYADRYTYVPLIGIFICFSWGFSRIGSRSKSTIPDNLMIIAITAALIPLTRHQVGLWRNSKTLFTHTVNRTTNNFLMHENLAIVLHKEGMKDDALMHFREVVRIKPDYVNGQRHLGAILASRGEMIQAVSHLQKAISLNPDYAVAHFDLGRVYAQMNKPEDATRHLKIVLDLIPVHKRARLDLGTLLMVQQHYRDAIACYSEGIAIHPESAEMHRALGDALVYAGEHTSAIPRYHRALELGSKHDKMYSQLATAMIKTGRHDEAVDVYRAAIANSPDDVACLNGLAWLLATSPHTHIRNGVDAVRLTERAAVLTGYTNPAVLDTLAAAYAEIGDFDNAVETAGKASDIAAKELPDNVAAEIRNRIACYRDHRPYRQSTPVTTSPRRDAGQ